MSANNERRAREIWRRLNFLRREGLLSYCSIGTNEGIQKWYEIYRRLGGGKPFWMSKERFISKCTLVVEENYVGSPNAVELKFAKHGKAYFWNGDGSAKEYGVESVNAAFGAAIKLGFFQADICNDAVTTQIDISQVYEQLQDCLDPQN
jgi:hypothetical protein